MTTSQALRTIPWCRLSTTAFGLSRSECNLWIYSWSMFSLFVRACGWIKKTNPLKLSGKVLHIPDWLPGSSIKRDARELCARRNWFVETFYRDVKGRMVSFMYTRKQWSWIGVIASQRSHEYIDGVGTYQSDGQFWCTISPRIWEGSQGNLHEWYYW